MTDKPLHILKFGGSSLYDAEKIKNAARIVKDRVGKVKIAVVVSALGGVTDELILLINKARNRDQDWEKQFNLLRERHLTILNELFEDKEPADEPSQIKNLLDGADSRLQRIFQGEPVTPELQDEILSYGERSSSAIFATALRNTGIPSESFESQNFIRTNQKFGEADIDPETTARLIHDTFSSVNGSTPVITGFIGSTVDRRITTLGRSGSDYTAGIIGEALKAKQVEIWTDVNGVLTADPKIAPTAITIPYLHYSEIAEMAHFGTKVLHPRTVLPLELLKIPIYIKNAFAPEEAGTLISDTFPQTNGRLRSVSVKKDIVLIGIKSKGLDKIEKLSPRALHALAQADIPILFNTSASSDYGISTVIDASRKGQAYKVLVKAFEKEYALDLLEQPLFIDDVNMVTVIGESLRKDIGLSGAVLSVLGENNIAPLATARGVDNRHLSLLIHHDQTYRATRLLNDHFCVHASCLRLFVAGVGTIGGEFVRQVGELKNQNVELSIIGACDSERTIWDPNGIPASGLHDIPSDGEPTSWEHIIDRLISEFPYRTVFVDATGSGDVARLYDRLLEAGIHIATPSKRAMTLEQSYFEKLIGYTETNKTHFFFEPSVGAGLPVLQTLRDLQANGDKVTKISGVVSGTMTYLFGQLEKGEPFGEAVRKAKELGYSEPDPRDDLSGEDVVRKFMILARASGFHVERDEVEVENLTPEELAGVSTEEFLERISDFDEEWKLKVEKATKNDRLLRYVGEMENGTIKIGTEAVPRDSSMGSLQGTDNQIIIHTTRYQESPIVIQGPGAGRQVTAGGLLSDVQKIGRLVF